MKKKVLACLLVITFLVTFFNASYVGNAAENGICTIKGTIFLPEGEKAPVGGIRLNVKTSGYLDEPQECIIAEGENSTDYSLNISSKASYKVKCELLTSLDAYYSLSFFKKDSSTPFEGLADKVDIVGNDLSGINITLIKNRKVSGTLVLPDNTLVKTDSTITVSAAAQSDPHFVFDADPMPDVYLIKQATVVFKENKTTANFEILLPEYSPGYFFNYSFSGVIPGVCPSSDNYIVRTPVTEDRNITLSMDKGNIIKGKISLPEGIIAGEAGIPVTVSAIFFTTHTTIAGLTEYANYIKSQVIIPAGQNSTSYEVTVYPAYNRSYYMMYSLEGTEYLDEGYYSSSGTQSVLNRYNSAVNTVSDVEGIDLTILNGVKVSGWIIYPGNATAPRDVSGTIRLSDYTGIVYGNNKATISKNAKFIIKQGQSRTPFTLIAPIDSKGLQLSYILDDGYSNQECASEGYYSPTGSVIYSSGAFKFDVSNKPVEDISFNIPGTKKISGTLMFPEDMETLDEEIYFNIRVTDLGVDKNIVGISNIKDTSCAIPAGQRSSTFEIYVPEDFKEVNILYKNYFGQTPFVLNGFVGVDGTVLDEEDAKIVHPGEADSNNLIIKLIKGQRISGKLTVPDDVEFPKSLSGFQVEYNFIDETGKDLSGRSNGMFLTEKTRTLEFFLNIPPRYIGKEFTLRASWLNAGEHYLYYAGDYASENLSEAKIFKYDGKDIKDLIFKLDTRKSMNYDFKVDTTFSTSKLIPNQMITAKVTATNTSSDPYTGVKDVLVIVGLYDSNNTMVNVSYISKGIPYCGTETLTAGFKLPVNVSGLKVKAFMWDGTDIKTSDMIPLSNVKEIPET